MIEKIDKYSIIKNGTKKKMFKHNIKNEITLY